MLKSTIESLLFITHRPLTLSEMAHFTESAVEDVSKVLKTLIDEYKDTHKGITIVQNGTEYQMVTDAKNSKAVSKFLKQEITGELTPASLETLSIIAYRGPVVKTEIEQIRGVSCSIILRNLLIKGLIVELDKEKQVYHVSLDFIRQLGISDIGDLPNYNRVGRDIPLSSLIDKDNN